MKKKVAVPEFPALRPVRNRDHLSNDISLPVALTILVAIVIYNFINLSPAIQIGFVSDDFYYLNTPRLESLNDVPQAVSHSLSRAPRILSQGFLFIAGRYLWGLDYRKWHTFGLIIGALTICVQFVFLAGILKNRLSAIIGTGIFALSGVIYIPQVWISATGELMATAFVCLSLLAHALAINATRLKGHSPISMDVSGVLLMACALMSKETMIFAVPVFILMDFLMLRRLTRASVAVLFLGGLALIPAASKFFDLSTTQNYAVSLNPLLLLANLLAYFYDPLLASGGHYILLDAMGLSVDLGTLSKGIQLGQEYLVLSIPVVIILFAVGILWVRLTLNAGWLKGETDQTSKPFLPPVFGWLAWSILLLPPLFTPGHHQAYYMTLPLALLMVTVAPVFAYGLKSVKFRIPVAFCLILYIAWHPLNTAITFNRSSVTSGGRASLECIESITAIHPEIQPGTYIVIDSSDSTFNRAISFGHAFELYYPGTVGITIRDLEDRFETLQSIPSVDSSNVLIFRKVNGSWCDVTAEMFGGSTESTSPSVLR
jgi:hypothetical protein